MVPPRDIRIGFSDDEKSIDLSKKNPSVTLMTRSLIVDSSGKLQALFYDFLDSKTSDYFLKWMNRAPDKKVSVQRGKLQQTTYVWYHGDRVVQYGFASYPEVKTTYDYQKQYGYVLVIPHHPGKSRSELTPIEIDGSVYYLDFSHINPETL